MRKTIVLFSLAFIIGACGEKTKSNKSSSADGAKVFKINCALCHGADGKLGANGSKDLTASPLSLEERIAIVTNGKGAMAAYGAILSKEDIKAVSEYTLSLK